MFFDERILGLLDRQFHLADSAPNSAFVHDAAAFMSWLVKEGRLWSFGRLLIEEETREEDAFHSASEATIQRAIELQEELVVWSMVAVLLKDNQSLRDSVARLDAQVSEERTAEKTARRVERQPDDDHTVARAVLQRLWELFRHVDSLNPLAPPPRWLERFRKVDEEYSELFRTRSTRARTSPGRALRHLFQLMEGLAPSAPDVPDRATLLARHGLGAEMMSRVFENDPDGGRKHMREGDEGRTRDALRRAHAGLHARFGSALATNSVIGRFRERSCWYDRERLRAIYDGKQPGYMNGKPEDRLTCELARYLHDNGIPVLLRARFGPLEPDAFAFARMQLVIEAKVQRQGKERRAFERGFWQLNSYYNTLGARAGRPTDAYLIVFRIDGRYVSAPTHVEVNGHVLRIETVDLALDGTGNEAEKPIVITSAELVEVASRPHPPPDEDHSGDGATAIAAHD
jgi:hypothetical protein